MRNKKIILGVVAVILVVLANIIYLAANLFPDEFLSEGEAIKKLNQAENAIEVKTVQDVVFLDKKHVFMPFISADNEYGFSLWEWINGKWRLSEKTVNSSINIVKQDENDPSTYYFVWNFPEDEQIKKINIYLIRNRSYRGNDEDFYYEPRLQMGASFDREKSYGVVPLSGGMLKVYKEMSGISKENGDMFSNIFSTNNELYFSWNMIDQKGEVAWIEQRNSSYGGDAKVMSESIFFEDQKDIEFLEWKEDEGKWQNTNKK